MQEGNQSATEAEQEEAEEEVVVHSQPKTTKGKQKKKTGKARNSPRGNSTSTQTKQPADTPEQKAQKAALVAEINRNWRVDSFRDFITPGTWLLGKTNIPDNE